MGADLRRSVAIVGLGPKGLYALERLVSLFPGASDGGPGQLDVVCHDSCPTPGAGPNYDPDEPDWLRLNFPADRVDMWPRGVEAVTGRSDFATWWRTRNPDVPLQRYPPRSAVGRYLAGGLQRLLDECPTGMTVRVVRSEVGAIREARSERAEPRWLLEDDGGEVLGIFDEVVLTLGHLDGGQDTLAARWRGAATLVPRVFPVSRSLSLETVPPDAVVAVRGFALTCIDAVLALTEGRGGRFVPREHPWELTYHRSPDAREPALVVPFSRSGAPLEAKPEGHPMLPDRADALTAEWCHRVLALTPPIAVSEDLLPILGDVTLDLLGLTGTEGVSSGQVRERLAEMVFEDDEAATRDGARAVEVLHLMRESLDVATGLRQPGLPWGLGEAWRRLYPAIVDRCGGDAIDAATWPTFRRLAVGMERLAFGAPVVNLAKVVALVDAGLLDLDMLTGVLAEVPDRGSVLGSGDRCVDVDVVVDAVLPPPGVAGHTSRPIASLLEAGHLRRPRGRRGVEVRPDASAVGEDGRPRSTLAVLGRPTEDWIIGNDTLSRHLHTHPDAWARGVLDRLREATNGAPT